MNITNNFKYRELVMNLYVLSSLNLNKYTFMKSLIRLLIVICLVTSASGSFSQTFRAKIGSNLANMFIKDDVFHRYDTKAILGYSLGASAEFAISKLFNLETGLQLSAKGGARTHYATSSSEVDQKMRATPLYLEIPVSAKTYFSVANVKSYAALGPYIGMGILGNVYNNGYGTNISWGSDRTNTFKMLDCGLNIGAGFEYKDIQIGLTYGLGLTNIDTYEDNHHVVYNRVLGLTLGYAFARK